MRVGSSHPYMAAVLYFRLDLVLANIKDNRRNELLAGTVQEIGHFPRSSAMDRMYKFHLRFGLSFRYSVAPPHTLLELNQKRCQLPRSVVIEGFKIIEYN